MKWINQKQLDGCRKQNFPTSCATVNVVILANRRPLTLAAIGEPACTFLQRQVCLMCNNIAAIKVQVTLHPPFPFSLSVYLAGKKWL